MVKEPMSRNGQGGTLKWCPICKSVQVCAAVNPTQLGLRSGQRWRKPGHGDIQWFRRGLICQNCDNSWLTAEVEERFLGELVELRDVLSEVKMNAELYVKESKKASRSLEQLSNSLAVLRALKIYQRKG